MKRVLFFTIMLTFVGLTVQDSFCTSSVSSQRYHDYVVMGGMAAITVCLYQYLVRKEALLKADEIIEYYDRMELVAMVQKLLNVDSLEGVQNFLADNQSLLLQAVQNHHILFDRYMLFYDNDSWIKPWNKTASFKARLDGVGNLIAMTEALRALNMYELVYKKFVVIQDFQEADILELVTALLAHDILLLPSYKKIFLDQYSECMFSIDRFVDNRCSAIRCYQVLRFQIDQLKRCSQVFAGLLVLEDFLERLTVLAQKVHESLLFKEESCKIYDAYEDEQRQKHAQSARRLTMPV